MFFFENIVAYKKALSLVEAAYQITKKWPKSEQYSLTDQFHRSTTSIALNIAEGSSRSHKDFRHYLDIARGSCFESIAILTIAKNQKYLSTEDFSTLYQQIEELTKIIQGLKKSLLWTVFCTL